MMDTLDRLIAERACERMIIDYAALVDVARWDAVAALYSANCRMSRPTAPDDFIQGRNAILAAFLARPPRKTRHICANILVTLENAQRATAQSQILLFTGAGKIPMVGSYADILANDGDGWRFLERRGSLDFV